MKFIKSYKQLFAISCALLFTFDQAYSESIGVSNAYISGFITSPSQKLSVEDAIIVITHKHNRIFSLRSMQKGWFETYSPLGKEYIGKTIYVDVFKRGYQPCRNNKLIIKEGINNINVKLIPLNNFNFNFELNDEEHLNEVKYGYVYEENTLMPIKGAVIAVNNENINLPIAIAVTRSNGHFSLHYQTSSVDKAKEFDYSVEHHAHDTYIGKIKFDIAPHLLEVPLTQNKYRFSLGPALHLQTTDETSDKESGIAMLVNLTWHFNKLIVVNGYLPRYKRSGIIGVDLSVGAVPYRKTTQAADELDSINLVGIGLSYAIKDFLLPIRFGVTQSDTSKISVYFGVNVPLSYF